METEIAIEKGQDFNKLLLMRELMKGVEKYFETVKTPDADSMQKWFGGGDKTVSKFNFKAKLIIEVVE